MRRGAAVAVVVVCAAILGLAALAGADPPSGQVTSYPIAGATGPTGSTGASGVASLTAGPDGDPWFLETRDSDGSYYVGTVASRGASRGAVQYPSFPSGFRPVSMTLAAGRLWFTDTDGNISYLTAITAAGAINDSVRLIPPSIGGIASDSAGDLWITHPGGGENDGGEIGEVVPPYSPTAGEIDPEANDPLPTDADPQSIAVGPDGSTMWFTEPRIEKVASITQDGTITQYPLPGDIYGALGNIVLGPDGNLWVGVSASEFDSSAGGLDGSLRLGVAAAALKQTAAVLKITPTGSVTEFDVPVANSTADPAVLATGPDKQLWMADLPGTDRGLTSLSTTGTFTTYTDLLSSPDTITSMIADPGGTDSLWFTDDTANAIDNVALTPPVQTTTSSTTTTTTTSTSSNRTVTQNSPPAPPALTAVLTPVSAVTTAGSTLSGTISEPAGSPTTAVSYGFEYGTSTAYGSSTPPLTSSLTPTGTTVSATLTGLTPYTTYHYRLVASDCSAASCQAVSGDQSFTTGSTLQPQLNTTVGATTTAGSVLIELPGKHHFIRLSAGELIPLGATINTLHGTVLIQSATGAGELASGLFSGGLFTVTQRPGTTVTVLTLASAFKASVAKPVAHAAAAAASKKSKKPKKPKKPKKSKKVVNQVFGNAHGQFSTRGHYATAADEGTKWRTADRCDGTLIAVTVGRVTVTDRVRHRTFVLTAGHHYLAGTG